MLKFRIGPSCLLIWLMILCVSGLALAQPVVTAPSAILIEANGGQVLWEKNGDDRRHMASITKIMTMLLILEAMENGQFGLDDMVTVSENAKRQGGSQIWLEVGEVMSVKDLLYSVAVGSANDSAVALAEFHSGSEAAFVEKMNAKAAELGLTNTHFVNSNGLPESSHRAIDGDHYSSARDIAKLTVEAYKYPLFAEMVSTYEYTVRPGQKGEVVLYNYNKMFLRGYPGADGVKTGMIEAAGYCLSGSAVRDGLRLIAVVLGAKSNNDRYRDMVSILDYGYNNYKSLVLANAKEQIAEIKVSHGRREVLELLAKQDLRVTVKKVGDETPTLDVHVPEVVKAPITEGESLGVIYAKLGGEVVGEVELVAAKGIEKAGLVLEISRSFLQLLGINKL